MDNQEIICLKHDESISIICLSDNCLNNLICIDCINEHDTNHINKFKNLKGKSFKNEILHTNSLIEENVIKMIKIRDTFNENMKSSLNLLDLRIKFIIEEITKLLNDQRNKIMQEYEKEIIGKLDPRNLNIPKLIDLEDIKKLVKNVKDAEIFIKECSEYDEIDLKSKKLILFSNEVNNQATNEWIETNLKRIDNMFFGIGSNYDKIEEYQVISKDLFSKYKKEFINFYYNTKYMTVLKDFKCTSNYFYLGDSYLLSNQKYLCLSDSNDKGINYYIKKGKKVYIKQE